MRSAMNRSFLILTLSLVLLAACAPPRGEPIDLNRLEPLPTALRQETVPLRVAIAAVLSPRGTVESYDPLLSYLQDRLNRPVELVQSATYAETNELIEAGAVDIAFVCTGAYITGAREFGMQLLAAPEVDGKTVYHSWLIVRTDSPAQSMADLRGKVFAFTDPLSFSGWSYPTYLVSELHERPETFFARTFFTYSHDSAIRAVAGGLADAAAVDSLIYTSLLEREPQLKTQVKVIHRSPAFGMPPVVVSPGIRPQLRAELQEIFLGLADDPQGRQVLQSLGIDRFVLVDDSAYESAREVEAVQRSQPTVSP